MFTKPEVSRQLQVLTRGPNGGNPTPTRQGRRRGAPRRYPEGQVVPAGTPVRGGLVEAVGVRLFRAQAKCRKAYVEDESAPSDEVRYPLVPRAYWQRDGLDVS